MLKIAHVSAFHASRLTRGVVDVSPHMDVMPHPTLLAITSMASVFALNVAIIFRNTLHTGTTVKWLTKLYGYYSDASSVLDLVVVRSRPRTDRSQIGLAIGIVFRATTDAKQCQISSRSVNIWENGTQKPVFGLQLRPCVGVGHSRQKVILTPLNVVLLSVYSFIAYGSSKNWIKPYKSRPIHWQLRQINHIINRIKNQRTKMRKRNSGANHAFNEIDN